MHHAVPVYGTYSVRLFGQFLEQNKGADRAEAPSAPLLAIGLIAIAQALSALFGRTIRATVVDSLDFCTVPNNAAATMVTGRGQLGDCTLKAVKCISLATHHDLKRLVVIVATLLTLHHDITAPSLEITHILSETPFFRT